MDNVDAAEKTTCWAAAAEFSWGRAPSVFGACVVSCELLGCCGVVVRGCVPKVEHAKLWNSLNWDRAPCGVVLVFAGLSRVVPCLEQENDFLGERYRGLALLRAAQVWVAAPFFSSPYRRLQGGTYFLSPYPIDSILRSSTSRVWSPPQPAAHVRVWLFVFWYSGTSCTCRWSMALTLASSRGLRKTCTARVAVRGECSVFPVFGCGVAQNLKFAQNAKMKFEVYAC